MILITSGCTVGCDAFASDLGAGWRILRGQFGRIWRLGFTARPFGEMDLVRTLGGLVTSVNTQIVVQCSCDQVLR